MACPVKAMRRGCSCGAGSSCSGSAGRNFSGRKAEIKDDDNYEFLKVPLSTSFDDHVVDDATLDRMELDAHRRYFVLLEPALH
jgi:hypothetical protein